MNWSFGQVDIKKTNKVDVKFGETYKMNKRSQLSDIIGFTSANYYMLRRNKNGFAIDKLDKDLKFISTTDLELNYENKKMGIEGITQVGENFLLLSSFSNQKLKKNFLFYKTIPISSLDQSNPLTKIGEIDFEKRRFTGTYSYSISPDSSKILVYYSMPYVKEGPEKFGFSVYDTDMKELWSKEISLPYDNSLFTIERFKVSNLGDVHLAGTEYKSMKRSNKRTGEPNYIYHILSYTEEGNKIKDYEIDLEDKFVTDLQFAIDDDNVLRCGGFYSLSGTFSIKGTFYIRIDNKKQKIMSANFKEFPENFVTQDWSDRAIKKAKKKEQKKGQSIEMYEYDLRDFILKDDGGLLMLAEQYYVRVVTTTTYDAQGRPSTRTTYHYYYNDIIAVSITKGGSIEWQTRIDKYQHTVNDGGYFSSFATAIIGDKIYMIYNESAKRFYDRETYKSLKKKQKKAYFTLLVELNSAGKVTKEALFDTKSQDVRTRPKVCEQISEDEMIVYGKWYKKQKFAHLKFK